MSCSTTSCGCGPDKILLNEINLDEQILNVVSKLQKGDEIFLSCKTDFTQNLITVMSKHFPDSKIKAVVADKNANETVIKMKYPESDENCCGFCS